MGRIEDMDYAPQIMRDLARGSFLVNSAVHRAIKKLDIAQKALNSGDQELGISKLEEAFDLLCDAGSDTERLVANTADLPSSYFAYVDMTLREAIKKIAKDRRKLAQNS